ncbi:hypothetical protein GOV14_03815 [Candidatus Pacearchaeota archaeon]|nr:hypothetical protein [Candidatus Pacearchaeota archaeon]
MIDIKKIQKEKPIEDLLEFSIIILNKPSGPTSFSAIQRVGRKILKVKKFGHFGTLDPMVTGVLPIALNRACRLSNFFMHHDKTYVGQMHIHKKISKKKLEEEMKKFVGRIMQKPPKKSRVKRVERERKVNKFDLIEFKGQNAEFVAEVQAGTYIRKLIHDLGENIGGAHMSGLHRTRAGIFSDKQMHTIEEIEIAFKEYEKGNDKKLRSMLIPAEIVSQICKEVQVKKESIHYLINGKPLTKKDVIKKFPKEPIFSVFNKDRFIGIYQSINDKEIIAKSMFILN